MKLKQYNNAYKLLKKYFSSKQSFGQWFNLKYSFKSYEIII